MEELIIKGGLSDEPTTATIINPNNPRRVDRWPGEALDTFCDRVRAMALAEHAISIVFGGLPDDE